MKLIKATLITLTVLLTASCGNEPVIHKKDNPFIIGRIEKLNNNLYRYERQRWEVSFDNVLSSGKQSITTDQKLNYKIGDTLKFGCN